MPSIKKNLFFNFLLSLSQVLVPLVSIPYVSRILDPAGIGRVGFIDGFTYYFVVLAEAGIMVYGIREVARVREDPVALRRLIGELVSLHVRSSILSFLLYVCGVWLLWNKIGDWNLLYFSAAFLLMNAWACEWYFIGQERFGYIALRSILVRLGGLVCLLMLVQQPSDYFIYYAIIAGSAIITLIWNMILLFREHPFRFRHRGWRKHLGKVWVTYLISLLYSIPLYLDHVILRLASTATVLGYYSFSVRLLRVSSSVISDSFLVFFPRIASLHAANDKQAVQERLQQNLQFILFLSVPLSIGIFLLAEEITLVFFGAKFAPAVWNIRLLAAYPLLRSFSLFLSNPVLIGHGYEKAFLKNLVFASSLFLIGGSLAAWNWGGQGLCITLMLSDLLLIGLNRLSVGRLMPTLRVADWPMLMRTCLVSLLFIPVLAGIRWITIDPLYLLMIGIPACILVYLALMYVLIPEGAIRRRWHTLVNFGSQVNNQKGDRFN